MSNDHLKGTGVALVTPMTNQKEVDFEGLGKLLEYTHKRGVDYWVVMGTTGESATLTSKEKAEILSFVKKNNPHKVPIVYGIGGNNTSDVLKEIKETNLLGVSAILSVSPYYNKPSQEGIYQHYCAIADESPVPVILYNVPGRTASNITSETTLRLAKHKNIIGVKEASGDLFQCIRIAKHKPEDFLLISGDDGLTLPIYSIGGVGVISVLANAYPGVFKRMKDAYWNCNFETAQKEVYKLTEVSPLMYVESNPVGVKQALKILGVCDHYVRLPLIEATDELANQIEDAMRDAGLLE
ncbi:4-hydroxy-tetrahydrodipicolinate synthase [Marinigracilibium pacificum]|uniref:4-hydroxy-tetrahydrodipicolinate synthase n=1 Tax=Marinigracilibium pacificum TaxID=2729599 RepID=A0A848IWH2_9BACT|nr:4-hydroxy-tetrahydrodipicolinate synthase [Marinigracilibium pacificum]NMM48026.1 4-hydroxy-tetrahydrodipicolinate synthase [Marinigracilibium pacificum]